MATFHRIFLGTYTRNSTSEGIYLVHLDRETGAPGTPILAAAAVDPAWLALSPDQRLLFAIHGSPSQAFGYRIDPATARLTPVAPTPPTGPVAVNPPSHLAVDATGRTLLAANYRDGYVAAMPIGADGTLGSPRIVRHEGKGPNAQRQDKAHVHSVTPSPDNRFVIVADLGVDKVYSYKLDPASATLAPAEPPFVSTAPGAGPRHFKFSPDGRRAYVINELDSTLVAFDYDRATGALKPRHTVSTLPPGYAGANTTAEVRVHPNGRFVYGSNRGHDSIAVFAVDGATGKLGDQPIEIVASGAATPRNFALSPDGKWLVCGHQDTPLVTVFQVDAATGRLTRTPHRIDVPSVVCVQFYD